MAISTDDLLRHIREAYVEVDADLRILAMNGNAETLLRRDRSAAIGQRLDAVIPDATSRSTGRSWLTPFVIGASRRSPFSIRTVPLG